MSDGSEQHDAPDDAATDGHDDQVEHDDPVEQDEELAEPAAATGHPAVDEVLRSLDALDGRPVDEHVAAFEDAHEQLRRTLSSSGEDTP